MVERLHRTLNAIILKTVEARGNWARVLPLTLYFIRCTPTTSTGVSPFLLTHGWEPRTPLQMLYQSWVKKDLENVDLDDWIAENQDRLESIRDKATGNQIDTIMKRQQKWNTKAHSSQQTVSSRRQGLGQAPRPGPQAERELGGTRDSSQGQQSSLLQDPDARQTDPYGAYPTNKAVTTDSVKKIKAVVQDTTGEELITSIADTKIQSEELTQEQQSQLKAELNKFTDVLTKEPGLTNITSFDIDTGEAEPIQQRPYSTPVALKDSVNKELEWLLQKGHIVPSSSPWSSPMVTV